MRCFHIKPCFGFCLSLIMLCFFFLLLFSACGGDRSSSDDSSSNTGSIVFSVVWPDDVSQKSQSSTRAIDCVDTGISTVNATVFNSANTEVASQSWPCSDHQGTINGVPTGSGMSLRLEGLVSGTIEYRGSTSTTFTVSEGQPTNVGEIPIYPIGETLIWDEGNWDEKQWG